LIIIATLATIKLFKIISYFFFDVKRKFAECRILSKINTIFLKMEINEKQARKQIRANMVRPY